MQLDMFEREALQVTPEDGRSEPRLWIRRLVIWRNPDEIIREIRLQPGLNIIWSPDPADGADDETTTLGHGAGKSLFCRLVRYVLGEDRFADETQRKRIEYEFENGMVGADIVVDGTQWAVVRSIGRNRRHLAVPNASLEELVMTNIPSTGMEPLLGAIERSILTSSIVELISSDGTGTAWQIALAWLTRDQECRFDDVLDWRSAESDSRSPALKADRLAAVRALIGAIVSDELKLQNQVTRLRRQRDSAKNDAAYREKEIRGLRSQILSALSLHEDSVPDGPVGIEPLRAAAKGKLARVAQVDPKRDISNVPALRDRYEAAMRRVRDLAGELRETSAHATGAESTIARINAETPGLLQEMKMVETPVCPVCRVPIDEALTEGCKVSIDKSKLHVARQRYEIGRRDLAAQEEKLTTNRRNELRLRNELQNAERDTAEMRDVLRAAETAQSSHASSWFDARTTVDQVRQLEELIAHYEQQQVQIETIERRTAEDNARLGSFRGAQAGVFESLSVFFDGIIATLLPTAKGVTSLDGNGVKLSVELGGDRSTVAMTSLKVLAFDLAVMCMSIEGRIRLPAFLVHDSPREADMGLSVYRRLFALVHSLEPNHGNATFQYIVTTTTSPPPNLSGKPWLADVLQGTPADARLLKCDLSDH